MIIERVGWASPTKLSLRPTGQVVRHTVDMSSTIKELVERRLNDIIRELNDGGLEVEKAAWVDSEIRD